MIAIECLLPVKSILVVESFATVENYPAIIPKYSSSYVLR